MSAPAHPPDAAAVRREQQIAATQFQDGAGRGGGPPGLHGEHRRELCSVVAFQVVLALRARDDPGPARSRRTEHAHAAPGWMRHLAEPRRGRIERQRHVGCPGRGVDAQHDAAVGQLGDVRGETGIHDEPCRNREQLPVGVQSSQQAVVVQRVQVTGRGLEQRTDAGDDWRQVGRRRPDSRGVPNQAERRRQPEAAVGQGLDGVEAAGKRLGALDVTAAAGARLQGQLECTRRQRGEPGGPAAAGPGLDRFAGRRRSGQLTPLDAVEGEDGGAVLQVRRREQAAGHVMDPGHPPRAKRRRQCERSSRRVAFTGGREVQHRPDAAHPRAAVDRRCQVREAAERRFRYATHDAGGEPTAIELEDRLGREQQDTVARPRQELPALYITVMHDVERERRPALALEQLQAAVEGLRGLYRAAAPTPGRSVLREA